MSDWLTLCVPLVAQFEGCAKRKGDGLIYPYLDKLAKPEVWTRGFGRTYGITMQSLPITMDEAKQELAEGLKSYAARILMHSPGLANRPHMLAAVTSWAWNCGTGAYKASRLRRAINEERWDDAAQLILKPDTAGGVVYKGLQRRRQAEQALFMRGM